MRPWSLSFVASALLLAACGGRGCGSSESTLPLVRGADGRDYRLLDKGLYKAWYALDGQLDRIEYDKDGDGRPEQVDEHRGASRPVVTRIDANSDGRFERVEHYEPGGRLARVDLTGTDGKPELTVGFDAQGLPTRQEHDTDRDGRVDRVEMYESGLLSRVELDGDRDGRIDRWQQWRAGALVTEELDSDGDGRADRRLNHATGGGITVDKLDAGARP